MMEMNASVNTFHVNIIHAVTSGMFRWAMLALSGVLFFSFSFYLCNWLSFHSVDVSFITFSPQESCRT